MTPVINSDITNIRIDEATVSSSLTFGIDFDKKIIRGMIDETEALKQSVFCRLMTIRKQHPIYDDKYGLPLYDLLGQVSPIVYVLLTNSITETLLCDDRILSVSDFIFDTDRKTVKVSFKIQSVFGALYFEEMSI